MLHRGVMGKGAPPSIRSTAHSATGSWGRHLRAREHPSAEDRPGRRRTCADALPRQVGRVSDFGQHVGARCPPCRMPRVDRRVPRTEEGGRQGFSMKQSWLRRGSREKMTQQEQGRTQLRCRPPRGLPCSPRLGEQERRPLLSALWKKIPQSLKALGVVWLCLMCCQRFLLASHHLACDSDFSPKKPPRKTLLLCLKFTNTH